MLFLGGAGVGVRRFGIEEKGRGARRAARRRRAAAPGRRERSEALRGLAGGRNLRRAAAGSRREVPAGAACRGVRGAGAGPYRGAGTRGRGPPQTTRGRVGPRPDARAGQRYDKEKRGRRHAAGAVA